VFAVACQAGGPGSTGGAASDPSGAEADASAGAPPPQLTFAADDELASTGTVTFEEGGTVTAAASDGTTFELVVPAEAVAGDVEISLTPLSDVAGLDADGAHAVLLEPDGQEFYELARLTITPAEPIPAESQLMFEAAGDGADTALALVDVESEPIVILLDHFSIAGIATASEEQRARLLASHADNAQRRLAGVVRARIQAARVAELLTGSDSSGAERDALSSVAAEYQSEVLDRLRAAAANSCRELKAYVREVISWERQLQLAGLSAEDETASQGRVAEAVQYAESRFDECEQEAIEACQDEADTEVLIDFWLWADAPVDKGRAEQLCEGQDYRIDTTVTVGAGFISYAVQYTGTKCGGHEGEWLIDSAGTLTGGGDTASVGGPIVVEIPEGSTTGTVRGTAGFTDTDPDEIRQSEGNFSGNATFTEEPATLLLEITGGSGSGYSYGFLEQGVTGPGTLTFPLEAGNFCEEGQP
jgi:hypothetical protein